MEKPVRRGDPAFLLEWFKKHPMDEEFAGILDRIAAERKMRRSRISAPLQDALKKKR